ncbi:MAG: hypothetical protein K1X94_37160 [Sandaracinaceae bacterium]|nr:hypothetical protein [Sandaracinaceae bacterium]
MATWITDFTHLPLDVLASVGIAARRRAMFCRDVVEAGTSRRAYEAWRCGVRCIGRVGRRVCGARVLVTRIWDSSVNWQCAACGDEGSISNFADGPHDFSRFIPRGKSPIWGFTCAERELLLEVTARRPELRAVVARAREEEGTELMIVDASDPELDAMFAFLEGLAESTRSPARRQVLEALKFTLPTAVDHF